MMRSVFPWLAAAGLTMAPVGAADLPNGDFEVERDGGPEGWAPDRWAGDGEFAYVSEGRNGSRCVRIRADQPADISWRAHVPVLLNARYRLSGWIRTQGVEIQGGKGALLNIHNLQPVQTPAIAGDSDWTRVEVEVDTGMTDVLQINCLLGGWGGATGTAWYDDLSLELLSREPLEVGVTIDAGAEREPINPFIYGQFIEHLGRCIYGGIWAEMLEDRKFFHPVGAEGSPWRTEGPPDAVTMSTDDPYVGEHDPVIHGNGQGVRLVHAGLGLRAGMSYVGRIVLSGAPGAGPVEVRLAWGDGPGQCQRAQMARLAPTPQTHPLRFVAGADADNARLEILVGGTGDVRIRAVSLMPADNVQGMRRDTLQLLKELSAPIYRWPGGNFVSGYDWRDGIGDPDRRPPRKNPAWTGIEHNDFGIDEFMTFCRLLETEPYVVVNTGLGDLGMALQELEYVNGPSYSPMGRARAANGHERPYGVVWWGLGNEMYGGWQLGHMPLEDYVRKNNVFADALRHQDPSIKLIAVGAVGPWTEGMLTHAADSMDLLSEHFYRGEQPGLVAHVRQIPESVRHIAEMHRQYRATIPGLAERDIRIALDEWNYWYGPHLYGELGTPYYLKDALGVAAGLNEFARNTDIYTMANYAQTVNVIGAIKTTTTAAAMDTTGLVLQAYRCDFGVIPVEVTGEMGPLDVAAAWTDDRATLTIAVVNPLPDEVVVPIEVTGATLTGSGTVTTVTGPDAMAHNAPGGDLPVTLETREVAGCKQELAVPPLSSTIFRLGVGGGR